MYGRKKITSKPYASYSKTASDEIPMLTYFAICITMLFLVFHFFCLFFVFRFSLTLKL